MTPLLLLASTLTVSSAHGLDCAKASTATEKTICSDEELKSFDETLNETYERASKRLREADAKQLRDEQRAWVKSRNAAGKDVGKLRRLYDNRTKQLRDIEDGEYGLKLTPSILKTVESEPELTALKTQIDQLQTPLRDNQPLMTDELWTWANETRPLSKAQVRAGLRERLANLRTVDHEVCGAFESAQSEAKLNRALEDWKTDSVVNLDKEKGVLTTRPSEESGSCYSPDFIFKPSNSTAKPTTLNFLCSYNGCAFGAKNVIPFRWNNEVYVFTSREDVPAFIGDPKVKDLRARLMSGGEIYRYDPLGVYVSVCELKMRRPIENDLKDKTLLSGYPATCSEELKSAKRIDVSQDKATELSGVGKSASPVFAKRVVDDSGRGCGCSRDYLRVVDRKGEELKTQAPDVKAFDDFNEDSSCGSQVTVSRLGNKTRVSYKETHRLRVYDLADLKKPACEFAVTWKPAFVSSKQH